MFGSSIFRNDPFFNQHSGIMSEFDRMEQQMNNMMQGFGMPAMMGRGPMMGMPAIMAAPPVAAHGGAMVDARRHHGGGHGGREVAPFGGAGNMFGNMFGNMDAMMSQLQQDPNSQQSHFSSSSRVISYSSNGQGPPKIYEATSSTTQGPGGVRQTRKSERNSATGVDRMAIGHHIYDRGHVVERSRNRRTQEQEENQEFLNMDEEEKDAFHAEFQRKARMSSAGGGREIGYDGRPRRQQRAIESAEYHRGDRPRARHGGGDRGGDGGGRPRSAHHMNNNSSRAEEYH